MRVSGNVQSNVGQNLQRDRRKARHLATHVAFSFSPAVEVMVVGGYARESALSGVLVSGEGVPGSAGSGNVGTWRRCGSGSCTSSSLPKCTDAGLA